MLLIKLPGKKLGNFSIFLDTSLLPTAFYFYLSTSSTHTQTDVPQLLKKKKKTGPEILVTPHVVFICEK